MFIDFSYPSSVFLIKETTNLSTFFCFVGDCVFERDCYIPKHVAVTKLYEAVLLQPIGNFNCLGCIWPKEANTETVLGLIHTKISKFAQNYKSRTLNNLFKQLISKKKVDLEFSKTLRPCTQIKMYISTTSIEKILYTVGWFQKNFYPHESAQILHRALF